MSKRGLQLTLAVGVLLLMPAVLPAQPEPVVSAERPAHGQVEARARTRGEWRTQRGPTTPVANTRRTVAKSEKTKPKKTESAKTKPPKPEASIAPVLMQIRPPPPPPRPVKQLAPPAAPASTSPLTPFLLLPPYQPMSHFTPPAQVPWPPVALPATKRPTAQAAPALPTQPAAPTLPPASAQPEAPVAPPQVSPVPAVPPQTPEMPQMPSLPAAPGQPPAADQLVVPSIPALPEAQQRAALNMQPSLPERLGEVPADFFWLRPGLQAAQDPINRQLVFFDDQGHIVGRAVLPAGFVIGTIETDDGQIRLLDPAARRQITIARDIVPGAQRSLRALPVTGDGRALQSRLTRRDASHLVLQPRRGGALEVRSLTGGLLAQAYELGTEAAGFRYVASEEIVATTPALDVRVFVQRFNSEGALTGIAYVRLDDLDVVPRDFLAVTSDGTVRVLASTSGGVKVREVGFAPPPPLGRVAVDDLRRLGRSLREFPVSTQIILFDRTARFRSEPSELELSIPTPSINRQTILNIARDYLTVNWTMQRDNYTRTGIANRCDPMRGRIWMRPRHFGEDAIGQTVGPMPYRWGGDDTPATFKFRTDWGALAGNICTCREAEFNYCIFADSAGIDCSGFVSRAWGLEKRGTAGLLDVADDVKSVADLKPGDAFDWPQRHVRLFTGFAPGPGIAFNVLESSTRFECEGVCEATYRPSELNGYRMIRYRGVTEDTSEAP